MSSFYSGFIDELNKFGSVAEKVLSTITPTLGGVGAGAGTWLGKNLLTHIIMNTKAAPAAKNFFSEIGNEFTRAGFRHAISGKKISPTSITGLVTGVVGGGSPMYLYDTGYQYGKTVKDILSKVPLVKPKHYFQALKATDIGLDVATKSAPIAGAVGGGTYGYYTGKTKREKVPLKSIAAGALTGGLFGLGARAYGPRAPVRAQIKWIRESVVDPVLKGSSTRLGKTLDRMAKSSE